MNENVLQRVHSLSHYRHFCYTCMEVDKRRKNGVVVSCRVKIAGTEPWAGLRTKRDANDISFVTNLPDIRRTPPNVIKEPCGKNEVRKLLESEEGRINNRSKF